MISRLGDGAENLWNTTANATNALILSKLNMIPASHWEEKKALGRLEDVDPTVEALGLRDGYEVRERYLREMTFYEGVIDAEMFRREVVIEDAVRLLWGERG